MKPIIEYNIVTGNRKTKDLERAVLPTILWTSKTQLDDQHLFKGWIISVGWWAWGVGIMRTKIEEIK